MKKALLVGNNYPGTKAELKGCINDVWIMREILTSVKGFDESDITILIDTDDSYMQPTGENIRNEFSKLCENAEPGDYIMFHFSGHGTQVPCFSEDDHKNECLVPTDMNLISDDDLREIADKCKPGVNLTFVSDCCHSGGMLDHTEVLIEGDKTKDPDSAPPEFQSRELPIENVAQMLSQMLGKHISPSGVRGALSEKYGAAASKYAANMYKNFTGNALSKDQAKQLTGFMTGMFKKLGVDGDAQGAPAHTSSSGSEKVAATRPTVSEDIGVLITGCKYKVKHVWKFNLHSFFTFILTHLDYFVLYVVQ